MAPEAPPRPASLRPRRRAEIQSLRRLLPRLDRAALDSRTLTFGQPALDWHLGGGLAYGALHEIAPETAADLPAAFGFAAALLSRMPKGPLLFVLSSPSFARCGALHGHGLTRLGLDPARLILVHTEREKDALWALEEGLRSQAPAAVAGTIDKLDFKTGQRLHLAAGESRRPFFLLRPTGVFGASVALTRWRIGAAAAVHDRFGLVSRWRWQTRLERCRNGRPGEWLVEFDHAYGFRLAAALADPALSESADTQVRRHAR